MGVVEGVMEEFLGFVEVAVQWDVGVSVLEFVGVSVPVADVDPYYDAILVLGWRTEGLVD